MITDSQEHPFNEVAETAVDLTAIAATIEEDVLEAKRRKIKAFPRHVLGSYDIGDDCERYLYYSIAHWQDRTLHDAEIQALFDEGDVLADASMADLRAAGYKIRNEQRTYQAKCRNGVITGHVDWWLSGGILGEQEVVFEHKGLSYHQEDRWETWRDMLKAKARWTRRYPAQMQMYLYQTWTDGAQMPGMEPWGLFGVRGKESGRISLMPVEMDLDFCEELLQKAERVYAALAGQEPPERIAYDPRMCDGCDFTHICEPERNIKVNEGGVILDPVLEQQVARLLELEPLATEHDELEKLVKAFGKAAGREFLIVGEGLIEVRKQLKRFKAAPAKEAFERTDTIVKIRRREEKET